ncbi:DUF2286 domain-containing protein [Acidianus sulfidivorans JP7]|uniref:DUF2286 domain-containing protein n=1 Tax=Acidianus sulfidivorans JP7 TaxID=619593 RepID=A0A2U9INH3_9CREN|nr:DUF2286 domain-containing protein [Acidianus sulfidivorans]AWR97619.1 DUF2286 domain-containing protein [Acidianus sulfidivorans JP7]
MKVLVLKSENGKVTSEKIVDGNLGDVVRNTAIEALKEWNDLTSDFIIMKDSQEARLPLPLKPSVYEEVKNLLTAKEKSAAILKLPIYIISYDNVWQEEDFQDKKVYVITYYINDEIKKDINAYAADVTSENKEDTKSDEETEEEEEE